MKNIIPQVNDVDITAGNLEDRLSLLGVMKAELRAKNKAHKESTKTLRENIKSLENIVTAEVMERKETVTVGNIKAEFVPRVQFRIKKENTDEQ